MQRAQLTRRDVDDSVQRHIDGLGDQVLGALDELKDFALHTAKVGQPGMLINTSAT